MPGKVPDGALNEDPLLGLCEVVLLTFGGKQEVELGVLPRRLR